MNKTGRTGKAAKPKPRPGDLAIFPLDQPDGSPGYGIAKVLNIQEDGQLEGQWLGNTKDSITGTFRPMWKTAGGKVYVGRKRHRMNQPWTLADTATVTSAEHIADAGFELKADNRPPRLTLEKASEHKSFAWNLNT